MQRKAIFKTIILTIFSLGVFSTQASELEIPNTFVDGEVTSASDMNANFEAIKAAVNDNHSRINSSGGESRSQFVGFSATKFNGAGGIFAMQQACHVLVADSHMCDTSELTGSSYSASAMATIEDENDRAWIRVKVAGYTSGYIVNDDASLVANASSFSCEGWGAGAEASGNRGATVNGTKGRIGNQLCQTPAKVACCK